MRNSIPTNDLELPTVSSTATANNDLLNDSHDERLELTAAPAWLGKVALLSGLLSLVMFIALPFLPVNQVQSQLNWPQNNTVESVNAPLMSYTPQSLTMDIPLSTAENLRDGENMIVGTLPTDSEKPTARGLIVRANDQGDVEVVVRSKRLMELTSAEIAALGPDAKLHIHLTDELSTANIVDGSQDITESIDEDLRPQVTGIYTELQSNTPANGMSVNVEINSRFTSSPTIIKYAAMYLGALFALVALYCIWRIDRLDGRGRVRWLEKGSFKPRPTDFIVGAVLLYWHIFGANTSDDGFILTMGRASHDSTYMANYYRWFGVPESPFGAPYYDLLAFLSSISTASTFMRLPALCAALGIWFIISRMALPILGKGIARRKVAVLSAAFMFLAFWLPYNNGLRPEPIVALGALSTWVLFERAIATRRLFPAAIGTIIAAFTLACGPTGLMAVAALLAGLSGVLRIMYQRTASFGKSKVFAWAAMLLPFFAAGFSVLIAVFGDQTLMTVLESTSVRGEKGPALSWYHEFVRYQTLLQQTVDGSFSRRFPVLFMLFALAAVVAATLRANRVPTAKFGPSQRLVLIMLGTFFFLCFTPTKWSHHFGIFAGLGAVTAALGAVSLSYFALRSRKVQTLLLGASLFIFAIALAGTNGWWYTSSYAIPWWDKTIQLAGIEAGTVMLGIALVVLLIGAIQSFRGDFRYMEAEADGLSEQAAEDARAGKVSKRFAGAASAPIAVLCAITVLVSSASFAKAFVSQYPAYSVGLGNLRTLTGDRCALANDVLVETNTGDSFLQPISGTLGDSLEAEPARGFAPNRIPTELTADVPHTATSTSLTNETAQDGVDPNADENSDDGTTTGRRATEGVNGSNINLPFELDYNQIPVLGSYTETNQDYAETTTEWYELPAATEEAPLIVVSVAGRVAHVDINGIEEDGQKVALQYGKRNGNNVEELGEVQMYDIGPAPTWRNLRFPLADLPPEADVVRLNVVDDDLDPDMWVAFTPPRVPSMDTLNNVVADAPAVLDWSVPLQFPCQQPFRHYAGVAEIPEYRVSPDTGGKVTGTGFQDFSGGGIMGTAEAVNYRVLMSTYSKNDWNRDWGSLEKLVTRPNSEGDTPAVAEIETETITRSGLWYPGPMNIETE